MLIQARQIDATRVAPAGYAATLPGGQVDMVKRTVIAADATRALMDRLQRTRFETQSLVDQSRRRARSSLEFLQNLSRRQA